eukprot:TRINITY_DN5374_c0_g1_i13.p1 TRINITY_DN5374_c0_g1~~TRINITY_DN5374_c0_g1_i13.p1  ORF type:complete len:242 (+),score=42.55 TRINITY_DN5374_c0_g1_i13:44-769(+)
MVRNALDVPETPPKKQRVHAVKIERTVKQEVSLDGAQPEFFGERSIAKSSFAKQEEGAECVPVVGCNLQTLSTQHPSLQNPGLPARVIEIVGSLKAQAGKGPVVLFICPRTPWGKTVAEKAEQFWRRKCGKGSVKRLLPAHSENLIERQAVPDLLLLCGSACAVLKYMQLCRQVHTVLMLLADEENDATNQVNLVRRICNCQLGLETRCQPRRFMFLAWPSSGFHRDLLLKLQEAAKPVTR